MSGDERFTINCKAGFKGGIWVVHSSIRYRDGFPPQGSMLFYEGQATLLATIFSAAREGRRLGATVTQLFRDDGRGEIVEMDSKDLPRTAREMGLALFIDGLRRGSRSHLK